MKIVKLTAENYKRLQAVEITPDGNVVVVAGRNGQGKSSVLDAIWQAVGGGPAAKGTIKPIRDGEDRASVTVDLGDLKVTRIWRGDKTTLKVTAADGATYSSPQAVLDKLVGRLAFDPLAFAGQSERAQLATLLDLIDLPFDPAELAQQRQAMYDARTDTNRTVRQLKAQRDGIPEPGPNTPKKEVSVADLMSRLRAAQDAHAAQRQRAARLQELTVASDNRTREITGLRAEIAAIETTITKLEATRTQQQAAASAIQAEIDADNSDPAGDAADLERQISEADDVNRAVRAAQTRAALLQDHIDAQAKSDALTAQIDALDASKAQALVEATMPIDGLGFNDTGVTYRGIPFAQCSAAERLRVSMAMAMAMNPRLRVIRITDGSLLDSENMQLIADMAAVKDFQVWVERVDESGHIGVVIEDGQVRAKEATP